MSFLSHFVYAELLGTVAPLEMKNNMEKVHTVPIHGHV